MQNGPQVYTGCKTMTCRIFRSYPILRKADRIANASSRVADTHEATQKITDSNRRARAGLRTAESLGTAHQRKESDRIGNENRRKLQQKN